MFGQFFNIRKERAENNQIFKAPYFGLCCQRQEKQGDLIFTTEIVAKLIIWSKKPLILFRVLQIRLLKWQSDHLITIPIYHKFDRIQNLHFTGSSYKH